MNNFKRIKPSHTLIQESQKGKNHNRKKEKKVLKKKYKNQYDNIKYNLLENSFSPQLNQMYRKDKFVD